jgi:hypothetical protein
MTKGIARTNVSDGDPGAQTEHIVHHGQKEVVVQTEAKTKNENGINPRNGKLVKQRRNEPERRKRLDK